MSKILLRFPKWISPRISLPIANLGKAPGKIAPRFLPPWICSSARILARFAVGFRPDFGCLDNCLPARILARFVVGSRRDFGHRDFCFSMRILARFAVGSRRDFGRWDFCFPARILARSAAGSCQDFGRRDFCFSARFGAGSRRDFGRREFRFLARILPGSRRDSRQEKKSRRPKSRCDPGGIPAEIAAGSRQDPGPYFTRDSNWKMWAIDTKRLLGKKNAEWPPESWKLNGKIFLKCFSGDLHWKITSVGYQREWNEKQQDSTQQANCQCNLFSMWCSA